MTPQNSRGSEYADPHELNNPVPKVVLGLILGLVVWAVSYIFLQGAEGAPALGDRRDPAALAQPAGRGSADGRQLFAANCQSCHQASGQGLPGVFPPLAGSPWVTGDAGQLGQILLHGMTGPIEVHGTVYKGAMPAFGGQLSDAEIAAVASYVRSQWGNGAAPLDAAALAAARQRSAGRSAPWQGSAELRAFLARQQ